MQRIKVTSWNVEHLERLVGANLDQNKQRRRDAVVRQIRDMDPDILCILEGPRGEASIDHVANGLLAGDYVAVKAPDGAYATSGTQWIWFLVKTALAPHASLLPVSTWDDFAGKTWPVHYWGAHQDVRHRHYRHPQTLVVDWNGTRVEFVGCHLKSKFVNRGRSDWNAGGARREGFVEQAIKARIKLATEAANVRAYINEKFNQVASPAIFVLGDLNDGPGKEHFEREYLFFDLVSNLQGDVFFADRFLNHALFDFPQHLRWSVEFDDFVDPERSPQILLDHILFTQGLVDGSLPWHVRGGAGVVEHEVHDLVNANLTSKQKTSDHRPVSVTVEVQ